MIRLDAVRQTIQMDNPLDSPAESRWVTFLELAECRGISKQSASRLVRRRGWRRQMDNRGQVRILVPVTELDTPMVSPADGSDSPSASPSVTPTVSPSDGNQYIEQALGLLREQLEHERARSDRLEARIATTEAELKAAQEAAQRAEKALDRYYAAENERRGQGLLRRLRAAWRGD